MNVRNHPNSNKKQSNKQTNKNKNKNDNTWMCGTIQTVTNKKTKKNDKHMNVRNHPNSNQKQQER